MIENERTMRMWVTSYYKDDGNLYGSSVCAPSLKEAQAECDTRGIGEVVDGELQGMIEYEEGDE